jgi:hypothetical protein
MGRASVHVDTRPPLIEGSDFDFIEVTDSQGRSLSILERFVVRAITLQAEARGTAVWVSEAVRSIPTGLRDRARETPGGEGHDSTGDHPGDGLDRVQTGADRRILFIELTGSLRLDVQDREPSILLVE